MRLAAELLYAVGLLFAESLRFRLRIERLQPKAGERAAAAGSRAPEALVLAGVLLGFWILPAASIATPWLDRFDVAVPPWAIAAGAVVFLASLALRWRAQADLGRQWSHTLDTGAEQQLVTEGIYAHLRHPIYASLVLWALAQPLLLQNAVSGLAGGVAVALLWWIRVPREEAMMRAHFGDAYRRYEERSGRLLPRRR